MTISLTSLVPDADDLLALEVEELAGVLLTHFVTCGDNSGDSIIQHGQIGKGNFFNALAQHPQYPKRQDEVYRALLEAWTWLEGEGFLLLLPSQSEWFVLSRRAKKLRSRHDFAAYRKANRFPKAHLHPLIGTRVYPAFLRGEYDTAVFQAFREIEVAVRRAGKFPAELVGKDLMREAFRPANPNKTPLVTPGPLTDTALPLAEQEGMASLFAGAISLYKNPQSHRNVPTEAIDAVEVIVFASHLLRMVDRLAPPVSEPS